jgi:hypothetical protein
VAVIEYTTGEAGSGKTYWRCAVFILEEILLNSTKRHISNFPIGLVPESHSMPPAYDGETFIDRFYAAASRRSGKPIEEYAGRLEMIPADVLAEWRAGESGPWEYFADKSIDGCHIAIDECHVVAGTNHKLGHRKKWQEWLGEIRHAGATVEFLTQSSSKVAKEIHSEAGLRRVLVSQADRTDFFSGLRIEDWWEVRAKLTGSWQSYFKTYEVRKIDRTEIKEKVRWVWRKPEYFKYYDSYSEASTGGKAADTRRPWQLMSWPRLLLWAWKRNPIGPTWRIAAWLFAAWMVFDRGETALAIILPPIGEEARAAEIEAAVKVAAGGSVSGPPGTKSEVTEQKKIDYEGQIKQLITDLENAKNEKLAIEKKMADLHEIAGVGLGGVFLADGRFLEVGFNFVEGPYMGKAIESVTDDAVTIGGVVYRVRVATGGGGFLPSAASAVPELLSTSRGDWFGRTPDKATPKSNDQPKQRPSRGGRPADSQAKPRDNRSGRKPPIADGNNPSVGP